MGMRVFLVLLVTTVYAVVRYVICGNVSPQNIPIYVLNKSVSWSAVVFLAFAAWAYMKGNGPNEESRRWSRAMLHGAFLHVLLSMAVLARGYFGKFFADERMTLQGELSMLCGVLASYLFLVLMRGKDPPASHRKTLKILASSCVLLHLVFMGVPGWWQVGHWLGGMPPISLLSAVCVMLALLFFARGREIGP